MASNPPDFEHLKQKMRATWSAGDFGQIAQYSAQEAEAFVGRLHVEPDMLVLDVACGTGNVAIPAARLGAKVTGVDIARNLLEQARQRAASEVLDVAFEEGDAEQLPYPDGKFDLVVTMFGAMFAPRPERTAAELLRVCRPGGRIAMANWTPEGFTGKMFAVSSRYVPPSSGVPAPVLWGDEATARERLSAGTSAITTTRRRFAFDYAFPPSDVVRLFRQYFGPTMAAYSRLDADGQAAYTQSMEELWSTHNQSDGAQTRVEAEYLEIIAVKA